MKKGTSARKPKKKVFTLKERFSYWFDNKMTKGSLGFIRLLIIFSVLLAMIMAGLIILFRFNEKGEVTSVYWDSMATLINAWMPSYGEGSLGYLIMMSIVAIGGLMFTSVLIGIITSAIEEKIELLKKGNSFVVEKDHIIVLGFSSGEYTLLNQLILSAGGKPTCIVVGDDAERDELEHNILDNIELPKNVRIICRTVNITDPVSIEKCSVETCRTIVVSPTDDIKTMKAVLAVSALLEKKGVTDIGVNAIISREEHAFPSYLAEMNHISTLPTDLIMARMIAHSCTQTGLSGALRELFNFKGSEFHLIDIQGISGLSFRELMVRLNKGIPAGVLRDGKVILNPDAGLVLLDTDQIIVFSEEKTSSSLEKASPRLQDSDLPIVWEYEDRTSATIIGYNETFSVILRELPENVISVNLVQQEIPEEDKEELEKIASDRNLKLTFFQKEDYLESEVYALAQMSEHIVVLNDHEKDPEFADMEAIMILLNLRDFRKRYGLNYNAVIELQLEHNQKLVGDGDHTDYIVSSSMSSLILAQLAETPELLTVFDEILSNKGNELFLKNAGKLGLTGTYTVQELRAIAMKYGYIFLGIIDEEKNSAFKLQLKEKVILSEEDCLIVLGEN